MRKYSWEPIVLTVKNPDRTYCSVGYETGPSGIRVEYSRSIANVYKFFGKANGLVHRIANLFGTKLHRNYFLELFCIPDVFWGWIPLTAFRAKKLAEKYDVDAIYVSCSPWSSAIIGVLVRKCTDIPLIIDFRDPYGLEIPWIKDVAPTIRIRKIVDKWLINKILDNTDLFVVTTEETRDLYCEQYPQVRDKICTIHNGFDTEFIPTELQPIKFSKFTIIYTGEFYFYALKSEAFFEAISLLKTRKSIDEDNFQFLFYGDGRHQIKQLARKYDIEDLVNANGRIPYTDVLEALRKSHLQLLRIVKPMISTKLFEGIPMNVPFLATIPQGEVEKIIKTYSPSSYLVTEDSAPKIADAILDAISKYNNNEIKPNRVSEFLERFSREKLTLKLKAEIEKVLNRKKK